ncbi:MAG: hypothetical protein R3D86_05510 [Emcibacteraceae bacterium]
MLLKSGICLRCVGFTVGRYASSVAYGLASSGRTGWFIPDPPQNKKGSLVGPSFYLVAGVGFSVRFRFAECSMTFALIARHCLAAPAVDPTFSLVQI